MSDATGIRTSPTGTASPSSEAPGHRLTGVIPPLVTPLTDAGDLDLDSLTRLIEHAFAGGARGVFMLGTTGEGTSFTLAQRRELIAATAERVAGRGPVLAGVLAPSTAQVAELCPAMIEAGASILVATAPFYVATHPAELERHFRIVGDACAGTPLFAYNIPVRAGTALPPELLLRLAADGVIDGLKDSSGDLPGMRSLIDGRRRLGLESLSILTGSEVTADLSVLLGVDGIIPGLANVDVATFVRIIAAVHRGDLATAAAEQQRILGLFDILAVPDRSRMSASASSVGAVKAALRVLGVLDSARPAPPLTPLDDAEIGRIAAVLDRQGLVPARP